MIVIIVAAALTVSALLLLILAAATATDDPAECGSCGRSTSPDPLVEIQTWTEGEAQDLIDTLANWDLDRVATLETLAVIHIKAVRIAGEQEEWDSE